MILNKDTAKGLPGLKAVRNVVGLTQEELAVKAGTNKVHVGQIELGKRDCTMALHRRIASELCCSPAELLEEPAHDRLVEIEIAYKRRELEQLEAGEQKGVA